MGPKEDAVLRKVHVPSKKLNEAIYGFTVLPMN